MPENLTTDIPLNPLLTNLPQARDAHRAPELKIEESDTEELDETEDHEQEDYSDLPELITREEWMAIQQRKLIAAGNFRACDAEKTPVFLLAIRENQNRVCSNALAQDKNLAQLTDTRGRTALIYAAQNGNTVMAHELINAKASVNRGSHQGHRPLHAAIQAVSLGTVRLLCHLKADLDATNGKGQNALAFAHKQKKLWECYKKEGNRASDNVGRKIKEVIMLLEFKHRNKMRCLDHFDTREMKFKFPTIDTKKLTRKL